MLIDLDTLGFPQWLFVFIDRSVHSSYLRFVTFRVTAHPLCTLWVWMRLIIRVHRSGDVGARRINRRGGTNIHPFLSHIYLEVRVRKKTAIASSYS